MIVFWIGFLVLVFGFLALDLGVFHRKDHVIGTKEALRWTGFWIGISLLFGVFIYFAYDQHWLGIGLKDGVTQTSGLKAAMDYLAGYVVEKSLSLDNIFVMAVIFQYLKIPRLYQHRVLFWGILGALVMRGSFIFAGAALLNHFSWMIYVFGAFLIFTALKMQFMDSEEQIDLNKNLVLKFAKKVFPLTHDFYGHRFFAVLESGARAATPLFLALILIESTDLIFAMDSLPAIFAITLDPFLVFTSNIMAILGLRSLYFALAALIGHFRFLKKSLIIVLLFVGVKMILSHHIHIPAWLSLGVIFLSIALGILFSILIPAKKEN
ncbi:MAG: TerC family protein [Fibrobacter sp.]|jgi:tellurite resistance protein TerC|nr:TerC family protein [Fibrobacter sp.]